MPGLSDTHRLSLHIKPYYIFLTLVCLMSFWVKSLSTLNFTFLFCFKPDIGFMLADLCLKEGAVLSLVLRTRLADAVVAVAAIGPNNTFYDNGTNVQI